MALAVVIDDDAQVRCLIAMMLKRAGYEVAQAKDGGEGIELCSALDPEVVVTDIFMPRQDGIDVLREVKARARQPRVVAISGGSPRLQLDFLNVAESMGADAVIQKPFTPSQLLQAVTGNPQSVFA
jgi:two-component system, OmpR family, response regulator CpxR